MRTLFIQLTILAIETFTFVSSPSVVTALCFGFVAALTLVAAASVLRDHLDAGERR